jgi:hypothetical protein
MKAFTGYVVVDGHTLNGMLGVEHHRGGRMDAPLGTYFGAVFFNRRFALEKAKQWGDTAKVVRVRVSEAK